jgi:hypothetical protein
MSRKPRTMGLHPLHWALRRALQTIHPKVNTRGFLVRGKEVVSFALLLLLVALPAQAALLDRVNEAFESVYQRLPSFFEWQYWAERVQRGEKKTYEALVGAMGYQKAHPTGLVLGTVSPVPPVPASKSFKVNPALYPSSINPNFLPDGTMIRSVSKPNDVFYIQNGKKSWILPSILGRWLGENHYYKQDIVITLSNEDVARYPQTSSVNQIYIGKVLQHPNGAQFYIDDRLRKRPFSAAVRSALRFPGGNLYPTTAAHLAEFKTGPAITRTDIQPGGMLIYDGPFHGGRLWRIEEANDGVLTKRLYLSDYIYEADGNPDESQRVLASAAELARYRRGSNIEQYPNGWVVGIDANVYIVQNGSLRLITSKEIFKAMGYKDKYILKVFPVFLKRYPLGQSIGAFKSIVASNAATKGAPQAAPNTASNLIKVRPTIRALISQVNDIALPAYDRELTVAENKFWVDYLYNGEVNNKTDLVAAMQRAKETGRLPGLTSRTAVLEAGLLENKWFPYLFYFVWQREPGDEERAYWFGRIESGDRNTIEKLGGTLQWLKDTSGVSHK